MVPSYYEYYNSVKIISGLEALDSLPAELLRLGVRRPILITDKGVMNAGLIDIVKASFSNGDGAVIGAIYDDTPIDSSIHAVNEIAAIYRENGCDAIVAVGGGSAIDTAKGVNIVLSEDADDLLKFTGNNRVRATMKPFVVIPTTGGTGSEVTMAAVIANPDLNVKMQFVTPLMLPDFAVLDPRMTMTMPPHITAATGMDALTHVVESFMSLQCNPISNSFAFSAIELIMANLVKAVKEGDNMEYRLAMSNAALLAGVAFSNAMVGVVHSVAHALGGVCHVPHGMANSIILPHGMAYNLSMVEDVVAEMLLPLAGPEVYAKTPRKDRAMKSIETVKALARELNELCGLPLTLKEARVPEEKLEEVAWVAVNDGAANFNPVQIEYEDALEILRKAYQ
ncbi:MAG: iron-containing alcohol dehydrogenase [Thermodesulfobacteriota bacterium]|nr:iron-containing alcohol dehydrogenase [Thermodesulfobacteriota bacterium]